MRAEMFNNPSAVMQNKRSPQWHNLIRLQGKQLC
jgi:hypothetical protein